MKRHDPFKHRHFTFSYRGRPGGVQCSGSACQAMVKRNSYYVPLNFSDYADALACLLVAEYVLKGAP